MNKWVLNRVGLLNFWYYQKQIFQFSDGKMLFRGSNGSGKSLTMQSLFPVLFDGNTSAYRLDSFGSRDRKMEDYLLGEKGVSTREDGIGYLFLEVKKEHREEYLTVGIGMHANRGGKLSKWFFAIENNQRIGIDFELYEEYRKDEITPLTKQKLKNRLESIGQVFNNQKEYKQYVNERIFGFENIEQLDELIALLINLRSPKLSKEFNPSAIYDILKDSLPKLKEDELLNLSKTIEQLDGHHERLADLSQEVKNLSKFSQSYKKWHQELVGQLAGKWIRFSDDRKIIEKNIFQQEKKKKLVETSLSEEKATNEQLEQDIDVLLKTISSLNSHEGIELARRGDELAYELAETKKSLSQNKVRHQRKSKDLLEQQTQLDAYQNEQEILRKELDELIIDNEQYLIYVGLDELNKTFSEKLRTEMTLAEFNYWKNEVRHRKEQLEKVIQSLKELEKDQEQWRQLDKEVGEYQQKIDEHEKDIRQWQQTRQSEIEKWKQAFNLWLKEVSFEVSDQVYFAVLHQMDQLLKEDYHEEVVLKPLREAYHELLTATENEQIPLKQQIVSLNEQKEVNLQEIKEWQNKKVPVIPLTAERGMNREKMTGNKQFVPFYRSVDFLPHVPEDIQNNIEGALLSSGILDSLISNEGLNLSDDRQIKPSPKFYTPTLFDYLEISNDIPSTLIETVADILQSITVDEFDEEHPAVFSDGSYRISNLYGHMPNNYQASYIGAASQERYRQERIKQLAEKNDWIKAQIEGLILEIDTIKKKKKVIIAEYETCPKGQEIKQAIIEKEKVNLRKQILLDELGKLASRLNELGLLIKNNDRRLQSLTKQNQFKLTVASYEEARGYTQNYEENLVDSHQLYLRIKNQNRNIETLQQIIERQLEEELEYRQVINDSQAKAEKYEKLLEENTKQQQLLNVEEVQRSLTKMSRNLEQKKNEKKEIEESIHQNDKELMMVEKMLFDDRESLITKKYIEEKWSELFFKEANHFELLEEPLEPYAKKIKREANLALLQKLESNINEQYNFYISDNLMNYNPQLLSLPITDVSLEDENRLGEWVSYNQIKSPQFKLEEETCDTFDLLNRLKEQRLILDDLLKKDEEDLFKNFILESVGNILRTRIQQAMKWVDQMNRLLKEQKNSSGLSLSIQWKPAPKSSEQELGTSRLVELLQKPVEILSETDKLAISHHFQEKVMYAQEQVEKNEDGESVLFQAITRVLDYRDWFEFELRYKRGNEGYNWQVLSDRRFNQFSGGEKAIAMYLPLFIAVYSRYSDAESFCPKVITLDEAFAGIDELNIAELFKACEQLGFNYVMNSQALFGAYSTVSSLMIYELLRPQNANLVTVINYHWDGKEKSLLMEGI